MARDFVIGCVGKPSSGKSTFFNAVCVNPNAKTAAHPFTTIEPNHGVAFFTTDCPCVKYNVKCAPSFGSCRNGVRRVPVKLLDVAGLIPGANEGRGIGNKFLDDLRHADVLMHIIDVSGRTNEKGDATIGYDPSGDHSWLVEEIELWIYNNLLPKWTTMAKRHLMKKDNAVTTLHSKLSGYMVPETMVSRVLDLMEVKHSQFVDLLEWDEKQIRKFVSVFVQERFKFVLVLNKIDSEGDTDGNTLRICQRHPDVPTVMCSALAMCFLRKMQSQGYIDFFEGDSDFYMHGDSDDDPRNDRLKPPDEKLRTRLNNIRDLVLYRFGSTGVTSALNEATKAAGVICVYPVKNLKTFGDDESSSKAFRECITVMPGTTVREFASMLHFEIGRNFHKAVGVSGMQLAEDKVLTDEDNIVSIITKGTVTQT
ncbi:GTPase family protein [Babesia bovis T2Bo]|uniref:GTP binding protein, putative n=1 Tax=Babesia bovis TaxID=5865 RepID=A7AVD5_BABBO|nr:GTPase family protein [Babesia bovis T2Bo]EDO05761.1 GTPase family protein [Babesia bovis T2Bo]|eukprot:XP_001609329.1 GTP binding protein [Babesia bovis T2Bo]